MDKEEIRIHNYLEWLMTDTSLKGMDYSRRFIEYYNLRGFDVKKFKYRQAYRERLLLSITEN